MLVASTSDFRLGGYTGRCQETRDGAFVKWGNEMNVKVRIDYVAFMRTTGLKDGMSMTSIHHMKENRVVDGGGAV